MQWPAVLSSESQWDCISMIPAGTTAQLVVRRNVGRGCHSYLVSLPVTELSDAGQIFPAVHTTHEKYLN